MTGTLDHIVINTVTKMDDAAALFEALGFNLTPRGYHSLGSLNHLMMTRGAYLELVGVPPTGLQRADVLESPPGLNGLVLKSVDADGTYRDLAGLGLEPSHPVGFSRPVTIDGAEAMARFRTVRLPSAMFPAGRVYFCEHLTPDYVWRPEWFDHPNGFLGFGTLTVDTPDMARDIGLYAKVCDRPAMPLENGVRLAIDGCTIDLITGDKASFRAITLVFDELDVIRMRASAQPDLVWKGWPDGSATLDIPSLHVTLHCRRAS
ncbi:VOC family protein [Rhizobium johnstonii]|uniref:VOC family protein n=1 Tax=Rhizobium johnstonii TaxID=3019933 RepID=UPI003F9831FF